MCKSKNVNQAKAESEEGVQEDEGSDSDEVSESYNVNLFRVKVANRVKPSFLPKEHSNKDLKVQVIVNKNMDTFMADTVARISVFGTKQAKK